MDPVVISYYPGSGGNRLAYKLIGYDWQADPGTAFHRGGHHLHYINYNDRDIRPYPTNSTRIIHRSNLIELTHCLNSNLIARHFPGRRVIKIKSKLTQSLGRYWRVAGQFQFQQEILKISQQHAMDKVISWHWDYYTNVKVDWEADELHDIDSGTDEFCEFMRQDLINTQSLDFEQYAFTWQKFKRKSLTF